MATPPLMHTSNISARRFAEFFDSIPAAVFRTTVEGKIVYCNRTFAHTFGFDSAIDLIDYPVIELYQNKKDRGVLVHSIMQRGRLTDLPIAFKKKDGTPIWNSPKSNKKKDLPRSGSVTGLPRFSENVRSTR